MADWDPDLYHRFRSYRAEPFVAIMERLTGAGVQKRIIDLGCGTGENTVELARRMTDTGDTLGIDSSPAMIEAALKLRETIDPSLRARVRFAPGDVSEFTASREYSMIFSNAVFQWLGDHRGLLRRCFDALVPGGLLVVQMPANDHETAQVTLDAMAHEEPWRARLAGINPPSAGVAAPEVYDRMLSEIGYEQIDCYYQSFHHPMGSPAEIVEWCRATVLRRYVDHLPPDACKPFVSALTARLEDAYATRGPMMFNFRRLFIWAHRGRG
jgi:trans-aconitate 2-methyltransferase